MNRLWLLCTLFVFVFAACGAPSITQSALATQEAQPNPEQSKESLKLIDSIFVDGDSLSYNGYDVVRLKKKVKYEYPPEMKSAPLLIEVSYAALKKNRRVLAKFEGMYFGEGNATDFGLFPLLGGNFKQLIVSQTIPRGGRHWVVDLSSDAHVIFDSEDYGGTRGEFSVIDIDKDGRYEISLPVTAFYNMQDVMYIGEIPLPEIIFKYDDSAKKYFPANPIFQEYALKGIEDDIKKLNQDEKRNYLSKRLEILLRYIYAGKKDEAWAFFDREYRLPDKEKMELKIKAVLEDDGIYKYIYRQHAT